MSGKRLVAIGIRKKGDKKFTITAEKKDNFWYKFEYNEKTGEVTRNFNKNN